MEFLRFFCVRLVVKLYLTLIFKVMKKFILIFVISLGVHVIQASAQYVVGEDVLYRPLCRPPMFPVTYRNLSYAILDDGVYELPVSYMSDTGHRAKYILDVKIQNDNVVCIYFGNGGYVHSGYNNSDYSWRGGGILWNVDWNGNIISGEAIIQVDYNNGGYQLFTVRIE